MRRLQSLILLFAALLVSGRALCWDEAIGQTKPSPAGVARGVSLPEPPQAPAPVTAKETPLVVPARPAALPLVEPEPAGSGNTASGPTVSGVPAAVNLGPVPVMQTQPVVSLEIVGPENATVGQPVSYEIVVRNQGRVPVANVQVEDELSPSFRYLGGEPKAEFPGERMSWRLGILEPGTERRIKLIVQANAEGDWRSRAMVSFSATCGIATRFTRPKLAVTMTGPDSALVGEVIAFQIRVANTGSGAINRVLLRDRLPAGLQHPSGNQIEADIGPLGPGESRTITLRATAAKSGQFVNEIVAAADNGTPPTGIQLTAGGRNPDLEATAKTKVRVLEPMLQVRVGGPKTCLVKCEGVFTVELANPGTAAAKNVSVVGHLPEGVDFVAASDGGTFDAASRTVTWAIASLEMGAHPVMTIKTRGTAIAESTFSAAAQGDSSLSAKADFPVKVEGIPAISLEVLDPDDPSPVDTDSTYEIRVTNQGTCPCTGIQITAQMAEGMELREAQAPAPYKVVGQQIQFASFARLATKADLVYRVKVRCSKPGDMRFRVQLSCDQLQQPVLKEESSRFFKP